jgi:hypothetical protein
MNKTKCILVFLMAFNVYKISHAKLPNVYIPLVHHHFLGFDVAQFNYLVNDHPKTLNFGINYQYRPVRFFSLNAALIYNHVNFVRKNEYRNLYDYNSKGFCFKYGYDFSVGITRDKRTRLFIGQQFGVLSYKETGDIDLNTLIWGNLNYQESFSQKHSPSHASELVLGLKTNVRKVHLIFQFYMMSNKSDDRVSSHDKIAEGYKSIFLPGYGFRRNGLNLVIGF